MKKILYSVVPIFAVALIALAQTTTETPVKVEATATVRTVLHEVVIMYPPSGIERRRYFDVLEQHAVTYKLNGRTFTVTNEVPTDKIVVKRYERDGSEWIEKK